MPSWQIHPVYQPIVSLRDGNILGFEALTRDESPNGVPPQALFEAAQTSGHLFCLEMLARRLAIENHPPLEDQRKLFLNVAPDILMDPHYQQGLTLVELARHQVAMNSVVLEVTEQFRVYNPAALNQVMRHYQQQGFLVAIDDFGSGYANLNLLAEIAPDFLKLDYQLVHDIAHKLRSQSIVQAIMSFAEATHTRLIAEGLENLADLQWLRDHGIAYGQGYLLGRPQLTYSSHCVQQVRERWRAAVTGAGLHPPITV